MLANLDVTHGAKLYIWNQTGDVLAAGNRWGSKRKEGTFARTSATSAVPSHGGRVSLKS